MKHPVHNYPTYRRQPQAVGRVTPCAPLLASKPASYPGCHFPMAFLNTRKKQNMQVPVFTTGYARSQGRSKATKGKSMDHAGVARATGPSCRATSPAERSGAHGGKRSPSAKRAPHPFRPAGRRTVRASGPCHPGLQPLANAALERPCRRHHP